MKLKIEINCDSAAFEDCPATEIKYILKTAIKYIEDGAVTAALRDENGNSVGYLQITGEKK